MVTAQPITALHNIKIPSYSARDQAAHCCVINLLDVKLSAEKAQHRHCCNIVIQVALTDQDTAALPRNKQESSIGKHPCNLWQFQELAASANINAMCVSQVAIESTIEKTTKLTT